MAFAAPSSSPLSSKSLSEFVRCQNFVFRPANVDACSHHAIPDASAVTVVNFKSYTATIQDPNGRLFDFLVDKLRPTPVDEAP